MDVLVLGTLRFFSNHLATIKDRSRLVKLKTLKRRPFLFETNRKVPLG